MHSWDGLILPCFRSRSHNFTALSRQRSGGRGGQRPAGLACIFQTARSMHAGSSSRGTMQGPPLTVQGGPLSADAGLQFQVHRPLLVFFAAHGLRMKEVAVRGMESEAHHIATKQIMPHRQGQWWRQQQGGMRRYNRQGTAARRPNGRRAAHARSHARTTVLDAPLAAVLLLDQQAAPGSPAELMGGGSAAAEKEQARERCSAWRAALTVHVCVEAWASQAGGQAAAGGGNRAGACHVQCTRRQQSCQRAGAYSMHASKVEKGLGEKTEGQSCKQPPGGSAPNRCRPLPAPFAFWRSGKQAGKAAAPACRGRGTSLGHRLGHRT